MHANLKIMKFKESGNSKRTRVMSAAALPASGPAQRVHFSRGGTNSCYSSFESTILESSRGPEAIPGEPSHRPCPDTPSGAVGVVYGGTSLDSSMMSMERCV